MAGAFHLLLVLVPLGVQETTHPEIMTANKVADLMAPQVRAQFDRSGLWQTYRRRATVQTARPCHLLDKHPNITTLHEITNLLA